MEETTEPSGLDPLKFELFKLEYEHAVTRYENIYKAIWQNSVVPNRYNLP